MLLELAAIFLRLGATTFGGPLAHIALMRVEFVEKRGWLSDEEFLDLNSAVNLIPGPNSTELAMHIGYKRAGMAGLWLAGACFIVPAMLIVLVLAELYHRYGSLPASKAILWGVAPVVVAVVVQALSKFAPNALKNREAQVVALLSVVAVAAGANEIAVIFAAAFLGLLLAFRSRMLHCLTPPLFLATGIVPVVSASSVLWPFLKMGCVVYGSGYVLLAYLQSELVERLGWITNQQLLDAIAVGQVTPGPVFTTATFIGYQISGLGGALAATLGIFGPSFLFVALLAAFMDRLSASPRVRVFLDTVNAASFALMALVTFQLARNTVFPSGKFDFLALCIGLLATFLLLKTKINSAYLLGAGVVLGLLVGPR